MFKKFLLFAACLALAFNALAANELADDAPEKTHLFGYELTDKASLVVETNDGQTRVWLQDTRVSNWPLLLGMAESGFGLEHVTLPLPDFSSKGADKSPFVRYTDHFNQLKNLQSDGLFVIPIRRQARGGGYTFNSYLLINLEKSYKTQWNSHIEFWNVPPIDPQFPNRRFQVIETVEHHHLVNVLDSNKNGESKSLTFIQTKNQTVFHIDESRIDFKKIKGQIRLSKDKKSLLNGDQVLVDDIGTPKFTYDEMPFRTENVPVKESLPNVQSENFLSKVETYRPLIPADYVDSKQVLNYRERPSSYKVYEFLANHGKIQQKLTEQAFYQLFNTNPKDRMMQWKSHQKLQISKLGLMSYQDSPNRAPLFLGYVTAKDPQPVSINKTGHMLNVTFEDGSFADYDLSSGKQLDRTLPNEKIKSCHSVF